MPTPDHRGDFSLEERAPKAGGNDIDPASLVHSRSESITEVDTLSTHSSAATTLVNPNDPGSTTSGAVTKNVSQQDTGALNKILNEPEPVNDRDSRDKKQQRNSLLKTLVCYVFFWHILVTVPLLVGIILFWTEHDKITSNSGECHIFTPGCINRVRKIHKIGSALAGVLAVLLVLILKITSWLIDRSVHITWKRKHPYLQQSLRVTQLLNVIILTLASFVGVVVCWTKYNDVILYDHPCRRRQHLCKARVEILRGFGAVSITLLIISLCLLPGRLRKVATKSVYDGAIAIWALLTIASGLILLVVCFALTTVLMKRADFKSKSDPYKQTILGFWVTSLLFMSMIFSPIVLLVSIGLFMIVVRGSYMIFWKSPRTMFHKCLGCLRDKRKVESPMAVDTTAARELKDRSNIAVIEVETPTSTILRSETIEAKNEACS